MKKIILLELCLLFLATTFQGDNPPPGWYIQAIPVNKNIVDIHFTDTLHGWAVTTWTTSNDTAYILKTTNGGINWLINNAPNIGYHSIQFLDSMIGYACGGIGTGQLYKTTNSGLNWSLTLQNGHLFTDLNFINKDTGWVCDDDNLFGIGLLKTTNGGNNWVQQLNNSYQPQRLFFLNKDTGWVMTANLNLYRTLNSGVNWNLIHTFNFNNNTIRGFSFTSIDTGWVSQELNNNDALLKTTDGGLNWIIQIYPFYTTNSTGTIFMLNSKLGYIGFGNNKVLKTTDGNNWGYQNTPNGNTNNLFFKDSLHGWGMHQYFGNYSVASTVDGGGPVVGINNNITEVPKDYELGQNYPNPFNQSSIINYQLSIAGMISIKIYDINGKEISTLINERKSAGKYSVSFNGNSLSSGIYFYSLFADGIKIETKRMMLLK